MAKTDRRAFADGLMEPWAFALLMTMAAATFATLLLGSKMAAAVFALVFACVAFYVGFTALRRLRDRQSNQK